MPVSKRSPTRKRIVDGFMARLKLGKRLVKSRYGTAIRGLWMAPRMYASTLRPYSVY